jgi:5-(carboxyamino)imidazole ribonucleotide synthase
MVNVLGGSRTDLLSGLSDVFAADRAVKVQLYGKDVVPGRKVGHVTAVGEDAGATSERAWRAARTLMGDSDE